MWSTPLYAIFMCGPALLIAAVALFASYYHVDDVEVKVCRPPTGMSY